jgi:hypothetical protein
MAVSQFVPIRKPYEDGEISNDRPLKRYFMPILQYSHLRSIT